MTEEDSIIRATKLFADLGYTQQPLAFNHLKNYLRSSKRLPQIKETVPGRLEALYAAEILCKRIRNFPLPTCDVQEKDLPLLIRWADTQKTWKVSE